MPTAVTAIAGVLTAFKATALGTFLTGTFTGRLLASVALSALQAALAPKPSDTGFASQYTAQGGTNPCSFVLGLYASGGKEVCPPMTHGKSGKTPNAYLTYVIKLGDIAGQSLERVMIDGAYVARGSTPHPDYGLPATGRYADYAWFKFYDGTQTVADPMLLAKYGAYPGRPWTADMVGTGIPYVICTFRFNRELFGGLPKFLSESGGIALYDPRKDTTVGGSGTQRWATPSTWARTTNAQVMNYNIARGITLPGLGTWGGDFVAEDLPLANWFTAMNECDVLIGTPALAQFQAGYEVQVNMEPASVMDEINKACTGQFAEVGGVLKVRVGGPGLPVLFITDGDLLISKPQDFQPFPNAASRQNAIAGQYPDPETVWQRKAATPRYNATWEAEDGAQRMTSLDLPACPYPLQAHRVLKSYITDARRGRTHGFGLPPDAAILEPMDVISWTSAQNFYTAKLFEISQVADDPLTILQQVSVRECDPADFTPPSGLVVPASPSSAPVIPVAQSLPGWAASGYIVADGTATARAPGGIGIWDGAELDDATGVQYQVRVAATGQVIIEGVVSNVTDGRAVVSAGMLRKTGYEMRALLLVEGRATSWTAWTYFLSPDIAPVQVGDIGAGAVNLGNMVGGSYGGAAENPDPNFTDASAWSDVSVPPIVTLSDGVAGQFALRFPPDSLGTGVSSKRIPVDINKPYVVRGIYRKTGAADGFLYLRAYHYNANDALLGYSENAFAPGVMPAVFTAFTSPVLTLTAGTAFVRLRAIGNYLGTGGFHEVQAFRLDEQIGAGLLGNGAVGFGNLIGPQTGIALNADQFCRDASAWGTGSPFSIVADTAARGGSSLRSAAVAGVMYSKPFSIDRLKNHIAELSIRQVSGATTAYLLVAFEDASGANIPDAGGSGWPDAGTYFYFGLTGGAPSGSYVKYSIPFGPGETAKIPSAARYARIGWLTNFTGGAGTQAISDAIISEKTNGGQIDTGAVASNHVNIPSFQTAGLALFGGALQSTNFVAGSLGWQITNAGAAEFNSLVVRSDMIAAGAVGRKAFSSRSSISISVTSLATAVLVGQILPFTVAAYQSVGGAVINPCMVTISCDLQHDVGASGRSIVFSLERRTISGPGAWGQQFSKTFAAPIRTLNFRTADLGAAFMLANSFDSSGLYEYRISAYLAAGGSGNVVLMDFFCTFEQLNRI